VCGNVPRGARGNLSRVTRGAGQLYAVVRVDHPNGDSLSRVLDDPGTYITVKEVLPTLEDAEREVQRLNTLNAGKGCTYFWQVTRFFREGRSPS
jgi:hypothetical protein